MTTKNTLILLMIFLLNACGTSHRMKAADIDKSMISGEYRAIVKRAAGTKMPNKIKPDEVELLDSLNAGNAVFFIHDYKVSNNLFNNSDIRMGEYFSESIATKGSRDAISTLNNSSVFDYEPMVLDNIYLSSYKILGSLATGDKDGARIEVNKAYLKQQNASEYFENQIEKANSDAQKEMSSLDSKNQAMWTKNKDSTMDKYFSDLERWNGYTNYMNPYTTYLSGLFFMTNSQNNSDYENASTYMRRAYGMAPTNNFVKSDLQQAEKLANLQKNDKDKYVWVIYENGMVAELEELRIDVPAFIASPSINFITFAMPKPKIRTEAFPYLNLSLGNNTNIKTEHLADVDNMFIAEYKRKLPSIITKSVAQTITKTAMQYAARQQNDNGISSMVTTIYTLTTSSADLRSWHTLPKNVQIAKIKLEKNNQLSISSNNNAKIGEATIPTDTNSIVYIRIPSIMSEPVISVIKL